ncbi:hypothetical protein MMC20_001683 [Loxospora ochrophaea]|nr:hypothetical protein [Loxospora ochrophaea]
MISLLFFFAVAATASAQLQESSLIQSLIQQINPTQLTPYQLNPLTTQILDSFIEPITVQIDRNSYVYRQGAELRLNGMQWTASGANVYWLGLDENVIPPTGEPFYAPTNASYPTFGRITEIMNTLQTMGAHLIRSQTLGVSVGNPLSVMPALGVYNEQAFATIDWTVFQARQHGLRIMAPLVDNYDYYHGGKFDFLRFRGIDIPSSDSSMVDPLVQQFYTNTTIVQDFKNYIEHLITHVNPYTGLSYAEDPTVFAYETGNELGGPIFGDEDVPVEWTSEISAYIKQLAPQKLVIDGTYGVNKTHLNISTIDIFSDHFYPPNNTKLQQDIALVESVGKVYLAGEYDWTANNPEADSLESFYGIIEGRQNMSSPVIAGDLFWSLFMHDVPDCNIFVNHSDGYTLQYGNPANTVQNNTQISLIREHFFRMMNQTVDSYLPAVACPGNTAEYTYL